MMEREVFVAGVRPGAPTTGDEIRILICYILTKTGKAMSFSQLHEALSEQELVNYFELAAAADALLQNGHITAQVQEDCLERYTVTQLGKNTAGTIKGLLPASVRDRAVESAEMLLRREAREKEVVAEIKPCDAGFNVFLSLPGEGAELAGFSVFCPTDEDARLIRRRFLNDPVYIYKGVMALLTGDRKVIGEMFPQKEELF